MQPEQIFIIVWLVFSISIVSIFLINGRKSLNKFPKLEKSQFEYKENSASGYSTQSFKTKIGGASNVLRIRVTKNQLWLTTNTLIAWSAEKSDLLHLIPIESLKLVEGEGKNINVEFEKNGRMKKVVIISRRKNELIQLLNDKMNKKRTT